MPISTINAERSVKSPKTNLQTRSHGDQPLNGQVSSISLLAKSSPSSLARCKEENDIFRYFDEMQSIIRTRKEAKNCRKYRKRNLSTDLVGIELNPGPKTKSKRSPKTVAPKKKAKKSKGSRSGGFNSSSEVISAVASQYLATVLAPCAGNARIPDMSCIPSFLQTIEETFTVTANAANVGGVALLLTSLNGTGSNCPSYILESSTSTDASFQYGTQQIIGPGVTAAGVTGANRLVSACMDIMYIGSDLNNSGLLIGASFWASENFSGTLSALSGCRVSETCRVARGMSLTYRPGDSSSFDYIDLATARIYGRLVFHASGLGSGAAFRVRVRLNFECLSRTDTYDLSTALSRTPVDPAGLSKAVSMAQDFKPVQTMGVQDSLTTHLRSAFEFGKTYGPSLWSAARSIAKSVPLAF